MPASQSLGQGNTNSWLPVIVVFPSGQCQSCHGILDYSRSEGRREHRALVFHFTDRATETRRAEVSSLRFHRRGSESPNRPGFSLLPCPLAGTLGDLCFTASSPSLLCPSTLLHRSVSCHQLMHFHFHASRLTLGFPELSSYQPFPFLPQQDQEHLWSS